METGDNGVFINFRHIFFDVHRFFEILNSLILHLPPWIKFSKGGLLILDPVDRRTIRTATRHAFAYFDNPLVIARVIADGARRPSLAERSIFN